jgi:hypothetical protein
VHFGLKWYNKMMAGTVAERKMGHKLAAGSEFLVPSFCTNAQEMAQDLLKAALCDHHRTGSRQVHSCFPSCSLQ